MRLNPKKHKTFITIVILILVIGLIAAYMPLIFLRPSPAPQIENNAGNINQFITPTSSDDNDLQSTSSLNNVQPLDLEGFSEDLEKENRSLDNEINSLLNP